MKSSPVTSDTSPRMLRELFLSFCWALSFECCNWFCLHSIENKLYLMFMQTSVLTNFNEQVKPFSPKFLKAELEVVFHCFSVTKCLLPVFSISISAIHFNNYELILSKILSKKGQDLPIRTLYAMYKNIFHFRLTEWVRGGSIYTFINWLEKQN